MKSFWREDGTTTKFSQWLEDKLLGMASDIVEEIGLDKPYIDHNLDCGLISQGEGFEK